ncbi:MAG: hypothetical protein IJC43_01715 [Clostridia bacterium]|nr:hypothetical protein [Clostridia bacterium]
MKKIFALLLALLLLLSLTACSGGDEGGDDSPDTQESQNQETQTPQNPSAGATLETHLWTLVYDDTAWVYEEDDLRDDEDYTEIELRIPSGEDSSLVTVAICVELDEPYSFREDLVAYGFDQYEYEVNHAYDLVKVGGVDCLVQEGSYWGDPCVRYFNRVEGAGATVMIRAIGEYEDERVAQLLSGLSIKLEDVGNVDGPWYWEGEPFSAAPSSVMVGTHTLHSQWLPIEELIRTDETFEHAVAVSEGKAYLLVDGALRQYAYDGEKLTFEADIALGGEYDAISAAEDGTLWISAFMEPMVGYRDGAQTASYEGPDYVAMHPSGSWGISWFSSPECEKISLAGGVLSTTPITFPEVDIISHVNVDHNYILASGAAADDSGHKVFVYDAGGNLLMTLTDAQGEGMGSITFMAETENGFLGLDGNLREVVLWTKDGTCIGTAGDGDLFGTYYPWFCGGTKLDDGSILMILTEDRADKSAMELVAFRLSGF